jgi:hypothetical protein
LSFTSDAATSQQIDALPDDQVTTEHHFSTNINLGWQKLDFYYGKLDDTPVYVAAVVLHPRMKWRWFESHWASRPEWLKSSRLSFTKLILSYKETQPPSLPKPPNYALHTDEDDVLSDDEQEIGIEQQLVAYEAEARSTTVLQKDSLIPYWLH